MYNYIIDKAWKDNRLQMTVLQNYTTIFIKSYTNVLLLLQRCASENTFIKLTQAWKYDL